MTNRQAMRWVTPQRPAARSSTRPSSRSRTDTLYSLSKEGKARAAPLVTALTLAVCEAAEETREDARRGGRLPVPMVAVLDEAANVCRWRKLPDLY